MGRVIYKTNFTAEKGINTKQINVSGINTGLYELKIIIDENINYKKLLVE